MTPFEKTISELETRRLQKVRAGRYTEAVSINAEINRLKQSKETVPVSSMFGSMTDDQRDKARRLMIHMFVYSDMMDGAVADFEGFIRQFDPSAKVAVCEYLRQARSYMSKVIDVIDSTANGVHSENHGRLCDEIKLIVDNVLNKYEALDKRKKKEKGESWNR